jgi:hypothetical protein
MKKLVLLILFIVIFFCSAKQIFALDAITSRARNYSGYAFEFNYHNSQFAIHRGTKTFITYPTRTGDNCYQTINVFDHTTHTWGTEVNVGQWSEGYGGYCDIHHLGGMAIDSSGYLYVGYDLDGTAPLYLKKSTNPLDISSWQGLGTSPNYSVQVIGTGGPPTWQNGVFPNLMFDSNDNMYVFYRPYYGNNEVPQLAWLKSTDHGATWGPTYPGHMIVNFTDQTSYWVVSIVRIDINNRFHTVFNYRTGVGGAYKNTYYAYSDDGLTWYNAGGGHSQSGVITYADAETYYKVISWTAHDMLVGNFILDSNNSPVIAIGDDYTYKVAYYSSGWQINTITTNNCVGYGYGTNINILRISDSDYRVFLEKFPSCSVSTILTMEEWKSTDKINWSKVNDVPCQSGSYSIGTPAVVMNYTAELAMVYACCSTDCADGTNFLYGYGYGYGYGGLIILNSGGGQAILGSGGKFILP